MFPKKLPSTPVFHINGQCQASEGVSRCMRELYLWVPAWRKPHKANVTIWMPGPRLFGSFRRLFPDPCRPEGVAVRFRNGWLVPRNGMVGWHGSETLHRRGRAKIREGNQKPEPPWRAAPVMVRSCDDVASMMRCPLSSYLRRREPRKPPRAARPRRAVVAGSGIGVSWLTSTRTSEPSQWSSPAPS